MQSDNPSPVIEQYLADPAVQLLLQEELLKPLLKAVADPASGIHQLLHAAGDWMVAHRQTLLRYYEEFQKANAQADQLLAQMESFDLQDFLNLDPISPYTLLLVAHKINEQAGTDAKFGQTMRKGRRKGALGPVAKAVAKYLKKHPVATTAKIWKSLAEKPPKGMDFQENHHGRYIEYFDAGEIKETSYKRFSNIVSEQRKLLPTPTQSRNRQPVK